MTDPSISACEALRAYTAKDDSLLDQLRTMWIWNDAEFQDLVRVATRCLEEMESHEMIPRYVAGFFALDLHLIKGIMRRADFLEDNRAGRTLEEARAYFAPRQEILEKLIFWMAHGERLHPPEHFVLPEWKIESTSRSGDVERHE
jgi:hypothetical protein